MPAAPEPEAREPESAREASKRATRRALVAAAREAFAEEGLAGPSLDAICARAGFTRGAFYVHFRSRDDLVAAVMEDTLRELVDGVVAAGDAGGDLQGSIERYVAVAGFLRERRRHEEGRGVPFHQILEAACRTPHVAELLRESLGEARRRLTRAAERAQGEGRVTGRAEAPELAVLLLLLALGLVTAEELEVPFEVDRARDALLALLRGPGG